MTDQATELRNMVARERTESDEKPLHTPRKIIFASGKGGVGTTMLAVNAAVSLAQQGRRCLLVDANPRRGDVGLLCGIDERYSIADLAMGRHDLDTVMEPGPAGIQVVAGDWSGASLSTDSPAQRKRVVKALSGCDGQFDIMLIDVGCGASESMGAYWQVADQVVLVTSPDDASVMDTYATIKVLHPGNESVQLGIVVNLAKSEAIATSVYKRISRSCQRFLGIDLAAIGSVPVSSVTSIASRAAVPLLIRSPTCDASLAINQIALRLNIREGAVRVA